MSQFRSNFLPSSTSSYREGRIASFRETDYSFLSSSQNYKRALYQDLLNRRSLDISLNRKIDNRRNGFVYEDIYAKTPLFNDFNDSNALYSSPYKPIKPEYLALPDNYSKYSTLPKNWNLSSSNSYKTHLNSTVRDIPHDYNRRLREYQGYKPRQRPRTNRSSGYVNDIDIYERLDDKLIGRRSVTKSTTPRLENNRKVRSEPKQTEAFFYSERTNYQNFEPNNPKQIGNYFHQSRRQEEPKKIVKFSEVSGCEERNNVAGAQGRGTYVRELEVCFDQVLNKGNLSTKEIVKQLETTISVPVNGDCRIDPGLKRPPPIFGRLPAKTDRRETLWEKLIKRKYLTQVVAALAVSLAPFSAGLGKGYSSPAIASLQQLKLRRQYNSSTFQEISVSDQQASWVASLSLLGALFGGALGGVAMRHGRKKVLLVMSLPFSFSWILTVFANSVEMMFFTSFMGGFCCSIVTMVSQVYVSEISVPDIRGCLNAVLKIVGHLGVLMSFTVGAYLDWQQLAMCISVAPIILFCTMIYIPETPSYLVLSGKEEEAYKSLMWLRGPDSDIIQELATIRANVIATKSFNNQNLQTAGSTAFNALLTGRIASPVVITCGLMLFQRFSGAHAFNFYAVPIFRKTFGGMNPHGGAIAVSFVQLLASCLSGLLIDTVGRLPLLIASSVFMSMALAGFGSYAYYEEVHKNQRHHNMDIAQSLNSNGGQNDWIPLLCVLVFTIAFSLGMSPISWLLIGELFPLEFRGSGSALATAFSYLCAFVSVKTFVDFQQLFGLHGAFWLYAFISVGGLCFVVCCVPETKGKDLDEMNPKTIRNLNSNRQVTQ